MHVYNRATGWGTLTLIGELPILQHGLGYVLLQIALVVSLLKVLRLIFRGGSPAAKD